MPLLFEDVVTVDDRNIKTAGRVMRQKPIGTGPFIVAEFRANDVIRLAKNRDYWKPGRPFLDAIEWRNVPSQATRILAFMAGQFDMTGPGDQNASANTFKDIRAQLPKAVCETSGSTASILLINHKAPPFDNPKVRRAISLALDRREFVKAMQGNGRLGGIMLSPPYGVWGLTPEQLAVVPGFGKDVERNRAEARKLMQEAGYGPNKKLKTSFILRATGSTFFLANASLVADQLRSIYIEGEIEQKEYSIHIGAILKGAYTLSFNTQGVAIDDPDIALYEGFICESARNWTKYCNREVEAKIDEQSLTVDPVKRKQLVQALDLMLQQDGARTVLFHNTARACWYPYLKGYLRATNGIYTHHRMEDVWMDK